MARQPHWQDPEGLDTINTIIKKLIPNWTNGLHAVQLELVSAILDGKSVLCCTATGNRKSAAFSVPTLVLLEYNKHPEAYVVGLPTWKQPIGVVITPTKGLAYNTTESNLESFRNVSILSNLDDSFCVSLWGGLISRGWLEDSPREPRSLNGELRN